MPRGHRVGVGYRWGHRGARTAFPSVVGPRNGFRWEILLGAGPTSHPMTQDHNGYGLRTCSAQGQEMTYRYRLDGRDVYLTLVPRYQPSGPHGPSLIVDPAAYRWQDKDWTGVTMHGQVIYELHVGTFTPEGTFDAAAAASRR